MSQTTNFGIVLPEGTDTFNPLTFNNNAFTKVDQVMKANQDRGITTATHTFIDGINTILRSIATCNTLVFIASSDYVAGSTIAVDGVTMTFRYADGTAPKSGAFKTNQAVMCYINGTILTMINAGSISDINASSVAFDNTKSQLEATNVQDAVDKINGKIENTYNIDEIWANPSPTEPFEPATIQIPGLSDYKYIEIIYKIVSVSRYFASSGLLENSSNHSVILSYCNDYNHSRDIVFRNNTMNVSNCERIEVYGTANKTVNNSVLIPYKIIGLKKNI